MDSQRLTSALLAIKREDDRGKKGDALKQLLAETGIDRVTVDGQDDAIGKLECLIRFRCAEERGLIPGKIVMYSRVAPCAHIHYQNSKGYVCLRGVPGEFDPEHLILMCNW